MTLTQETARVVAPGLTGYSAFTDEELVEFIKEDSDMAAFDELVRRYLRGTYRKVRRLVKAEDAEDVTQDIFLNLVKSIGKFKGRSAFATWFNKIVVNRVADFHRTNFRRMTRFKLEAQVPEVAIPPAQTGVEEVEFEKRLRDLGLPDHYVEVLILKLVYNLGFADIASTLGMTYEASRSRYRRAIADAARRIELFEEAI